MGKRWERDGKGRKEREGRRRWKGDKLIEKEKGEGFQERIKSKSRSGGKGELRRD